MIPPLVLIAVALLAYGLFCFAPGVALGHAKEREQRGELKEIAQSAFMRGMR